MVTHWSDFGYLFRSELRWDVFFDFIRLFWNQILTWRSVKLRLRANSQRFCFETYALNRNSFSNSNVWNFEYGLRFFRTETWWLFDDWLLLLWPLDPIGPPPPPPPPDPPLVQSIRSKPPAAAAAFVANSAAWWCKATAAGEMWWWWTNVSSMEIWEQFKKVS